MTLEVIHSETLFRGRVFDVRREQVRMPDGQTVRLDIVSHNGAVTLVPMDADGQIWFIRQYRHPAACDLLELPAGVIEDEEAPEAAAAREIREEIGMAADKLVKLGNFFLAPGYSTEYMHVFLATGLSPDPLPKDDDEFLTVEKVTVDQAFQMAVCGQIQDAKTIAALFLLHFHRPEAG